MFLDDLRPTETRVGWGGVGYGGYLGFDGYWVNLRGLHPPHCISTHANARLVYTLDGKQQFLSGFVALSDTSHKERRCDFFVWADDRLVAYIPHVRPGEPARELSAFLHGATRLTLEAVSPNPEWCHAVWVSPTLHASAPRQISVPLGGYAIKSPVTPRHAQNVVVTTADSKYIHLADALFDSVRRFGGIPDAQFVFMAYEPDAAAQEMCARHNALLVPCDATVPIAGKNKKVTVGFLAAQAIFADRYLCLDADMVCGGDLSPLFSMLDTLHPNAIITCQDAGAAEGTTLGEALLARHLYRGGEADFDALGIREGERDYGLVLNLGLYGGTRRAMLGVEATVRSLMPQGAVWDQQGLTSDCVWRDQFLFNLALARTGTGIPISDRYNTQMHWLEVTLAPDAAQQARELEEGCAPESPLFINPHTGSGVVMAHFNGSGRHKSPEIGAFLSGEPHISSSSAAMTPINSPADTPTAPTITEET